MHIVKSDTSYFTKWRVYNGALSNCISKLKKKGIQPSTIDAPSINENACQRKGAHRYQSASFQESLARRPRKTHKLNNPCALDMAIVSQKRISSSFLDPFVLASLFPCLFLQRARPPVGQRNTNQVPRYSRKVTKVRRGRHDSHRDDWKGARGLEIVVRAKK